MDISDTLDELYRLEDQVNDDTYKKLQTAMSNLQRASRKLIELNELTAEGTSA
jgi:hypothetical protein